MSKRKVILFAGGCFNPPTIMHLRIFELARDYLIRNGNFQVLGGIISPTHDKYSKTSLAEANATHRNAMVELSLLGNDYIKLSTLESMQKTEWTRLRIILEEHEILLKRASDRRESWMPDNFDSKETFTLLFLCGADLLESFNVPGLWLEEDIEAIVRDFGLVVISREGSNAERFIYQSDILTKYKNNIYLVTEWILNDISSSKIRRAIRRNESVKYFVFDPVIKYIKDNNLYTEYACCNVSHTTIEPPSPPMLEMANNLDKNHTIMTTDCLDSTTKCISVDGEEIDEFLSKDSCNEIAAVTKKEDQDEQEESCITKSSLTQNDSTKRQVLLAKNDVGDDDDDDDDDVDVNVNDIVTSNSEDSNISDLSFDKNFKDAIKVNEDDFLLTKSESCENEDDSRKKEDSIDVANAKEIFDDENRLSEDDHRSYEAKQKEEEECTFQEFYEKLSTSAVPNLESSSTKETEEIESSESDNDPKCNDDDDFEVENNLRTVPPSQELNIIQEEIENEESLSNKDSVQSENEDDNETKNLSNNEEINERVTTINQEEIALTNAVSLNAGILSSNDKNPANEREISSNNEGQCLLMSNDEERSLLNSEEKDRTNEEQRIDKLNSIEKMEGSNHDVKNDNPIHIQTKEKGLTLEDEILNNNSKNSNVLNDYKEKSIKDSNQQFIKIVKNDGEKEHENHFKAIDGDRREFISMEKSEFERARKGKDKSPRKSPNPKVQIEITKKGIKVIGDKESFL